MAASFEPRIDKNLTVKYELLSSSTVRVNFLGNAENEQTEFLSNSLSFASAIMGERRMNTLIMNFTRLDFCYSACVRVFLDWMTNGSNRPENLVVHHGRQIWQRTSLIAMARFSPSCIIVDCSDCCHDNFVLVEKQFFAPTGSGSVVTIVTCSECDFELSRSSEYFD